VASQEYRAIGVRMALSPSADLLTDPRRYEGQFTFGENHAFVADLVEAYVKGLQGATLGKTSVAAVVRNFPGAGPAKGGWDARLAKGKYLVYPADNLDDHLAPFQRAFSAGVAGVMSGYAIPEAGSWSGLGGLVDGATIEQVGASFHAKLLTDVLRAHYGFSGLVLAPPGILEDEGLTPLGAPWGMETATRAQRAAKAVNAGVDQFVGLGDPSAIAAARTAGSIADARIDEAARRALSLMFRLGLFEDPYVDAAQAPALCNTDPSYQAGLDALNRGMVLLVNADKPDGWLNGTACPGHPGVPCDGTQLADKGNAGNGTLKVLPAPPGEPYVAAGCRYFVAGNFDLDYVRSVSAGYGELTNDVESIGGVPVSTRAERMARSDYVFIRIDAPFSHDPASDVLGHPLASLVYGGSENEDQLEVIAEARAAIDALPASKAQIIVGVSGGRPSVVSEILSYGVSGLYYEWGTNLSSQVDKVFLDVAFGIVDGPGRLPVGLPLSDAAVEAQKEDLAGDGQHGTFVEGFGIPTAKF
jgi:beta-glucosidase-like glycosyl hydrolase